MSRKFHLLLRDELAGNNFSDFSLLPRSYKRIGHIAIINLHQELLKWKITIAEAMLNLLPSIKTIARFKKPISGEMRQPSIEWIAGSQSFETIHKELNTLFVINAEKLMLSSGNHYERKRIIKTIQNSNINSPVILDMFACVGNLSLPIIKYIPNAKIIAIEINPNAVHYLMKSISKNNYKKEQFDVLLGDNRIICPTNNADFVILGYFEVDRKQIVAALDGLKNKEGGILFLHDVTNLKSESSTFNLLKEIIRSQNHWEIKKVISRKVKSIGPSTIHYVFDCEIRPKK